LQISKYKIKKEMMMMMKKKKIMMLMTRRRRRRRRPISDDNDEVVKNMEDLKTSIISYYSNSPLYKKKICREYFDCFVAKWINARSDIIDTLLKETNTISQISSVL